MTFRRKNPTRRKSKAPKTINPTEIQVTAWGHRAAIQLEITIAARVRMKSSRIRFLGLLFIL
jgi:hypothetical protein